MALNKRSKYKITKNGLICQIHNIHLPYIDFIYIISKNVFKVTEDELSLGLKDGRIQLLKAKVKPKEKGNNDIVSAYVLKREEVFKSEGK